MIADHRTRVLLSAIDNALRNGSYMTGANLAFDYLCEQLGVDQDHLPPFNPRWNQARLAGGEAGRIGTNAGHGYAWDRPDGARAKCGGPAMCTDCSYDQQLVHDAREDA